MSGNEFSNQPGSTSAGRTTPDARRADAAGDGLSMTGTGEIGDRSSTEQAAAREALGAFQDEGYGSDELRARDAANEEAGLRARVAEAAGTVRDRASESVRQVRERAADTYDDARSWASDRYDLQRRRATRMAKRSYGRVRQGRRATEDFVTENPLLIGVVGVAAGLLLGALLPRTRQEDRAIGPWADEAREQGVRYARDMTQRGRDFVVSALDPENLDAAARQRHEGGLHRDSDFRDQDRPAHRL